MIDLTRKRVHISGIFICLIIALFGTNLEIPDGGYFNEWKVCEYCHSIILKVDDYGYCMGVCRDCEIKMYVEKWGNTVYISGNIK